MNSNFRLHSKYAPQKEADNFVATVKGSPLFIVVTEPGESYLVASFRKRFPKAKLLAIRYTKELFLKEDVLFDAVWRGSFTGITSFLMNNIPDEYFSRTLFLSWKPSENIWFNEAKIVWQEIKKATNIFISVIRTRSFFGKRWLKNIFNNISFARNIRSLRFDLVKDSLFFASGVSLEDFIKDNNIKKYTKKCFSLSASSSLSSLYFHGIIPDVAITTDGGFWAGKHLRQVNNTLLAFPLEAFVPHFVLSSANVLFLSYGSAIENYFFEKTSFPIFQAKRNGTVSGTAIELLLDNTKGNIFISGLDLSFSKGFSHARPNENMENNFTYESRLNTFSSLLALSSFSYYSLEVYSSWFSGLSKLKKDRLFRIGNKGIDIEGIERILKADVPKKCKKQDIKNNYISFDNACNFSERIKLIFSFFSNIKEKLKDSSFFDDVMDIQFNSIEKELCQLVAFSDYVSLIKNCENKPHIFKKIIKDKIMDFIEVEEKRLLLTDALDF